MRFAVLVHPGNKIGYESGDMPSMELIENMQKFNEALVEAGVWVMGEGLHPTAKATRLDFAQEGAPTLAEGPFSDTQNLVGGFWIWEVKSKQEALDWAKRAPMEKGAILEIRQLFEAADFGPEVEAKEAALHERIQARQA